MTIRHKFYNNGDVKLIGGSLVEYSGPLTFQKDAHADVDIDIVFSLPAGKECVIAWGDGDTSVVTGPQSVTTYNHIYGDTGSNYQIQITGDSDAVTYFYCYNQPISGDVENWGVLISLQRLYLQGTSVSGDIAGLGDLTSLTDLRLNSTSISGDIANLSGLTSLIYLYLDSTSISGIIANLSGLTSLVELHLGNTSVSGDIANLSGLTSLIYLYLDSTSISGIIANLSGLTSLVELHLGNTSVSGDIANLSGLTSLVYLYLYNSSIDTYTQGVLPDWDSCTIYIQDLGLSQQEVDDFLCDLNTASSASTKTLNISGTNSAPSATGLACETALEGKGWTVTVTV